MIPFSLPTVLLGAAVSTLAIGRGLKKKSLSKAGAAAAWLVGFLSVASGLRGFVLLFFYQIGSSATKYKKEWKEKRDATAAEGSQRGPSQVLACSAVAVILSMIHVYFCGEERPIDFAENPLASSLTCAVLAHHATCLADTLASELGMLSSTPPVLITAPWKQVPAGTNGGVTVWGTACSAIGGALMGIGTILMDYLSGLAVTRTAGLVVLYGTVCGLVGSLADSFLGAIIQGTYFDPETKRIHHENVPGFKHIAGANILTNVQVNLLSIFFTTAIGGWFLGPNMFP